MKKLTAILLSVIILVCSSVLVQAEDKEYDVTVTMPEVFYYDAEYASTGNDNLFGFSFTAGHLEEYKNVTVKVDFNKDVLEIAEWSVPDNLVNQGLSETETGMCFEASFYEKFLDRNDEANKNTTGTCSVLLRTKTTGKLNIKITATITYLDGTIKEADFIYPEFYEEVVDIQDVEFVNPDKKYVNHYFAVFEGETTVADILDVTQTETAVIINSEKKVFDETENVPNGTWIATLYNGFVVDKIQICIKGDVNCDGRITAADARLVLRRSAMLEKFNGLMMQSEAANIDNANGITAADARLILRKAAGLE